MRENPSAAETRRYIEAVWQIVKVLNWSNFQFVSLAAVAAVAVVLQLPHYHALLFQHTLHSEQMVTTHPPLRADGGNTPVAATSCWVLERKY